jgi:hypothetical protein
MLIPSSYLNFSIFMGNQPENSGAPGGFSPRPLGNPYCDNIVHYLLPNQGYRTAPRSPTGDLLVQEGNYFTRIKDIYRALKIVLFRSHYPHKNGTCENDFSFVFIKK